MTELLDIIKKALNKIIDNIGIFSILSTIFVFGISSIFFNLGFSISLFFVALSLAGFLELFHMQRKTEINKRRQVLYDRFSLFDSFISSKKKIFYPEMIKEFTYNNLSFRLIGFEDVPGPITISGPFCPRCKADVLESVVFKFPGRTKIFFKCICGFSNQSKKTKEEIVNEIAQLKRLPADRPKITTHNNNLLK